MRKWLPIKNSFVCKKIPLNYQLKNEVSWANFNTCKRIFNWQPFMHRVYGAVWVVNFSYWPSKQRLRHVIITTYKLRVRSLQENLKPRRCQDGKAEVWDVPLKTERLRLISCLLYLYGFVLWFCRPVISLWALWDNNVLQLANQTTRFIRYKHNPHNNNAYTCMALLILFPGERLGRGTLHALYLKRNSQLTD